MERHFPSAWNELRRKKLLDNNEEVLERDIGTKIDEDEMPDYTLHCDCDERETKRRRKDEIMVVKGGSLDAISVLSNGGERDHLVRNDGTQVPIERLRGKYLVICCFFVPLPTSSAVANLCRAMIASYPRLCKQNNFEMVVILKMRKNWDNDESAFEHFFSAFTCLTIPFSDSHSRDFVCKSLGLEGHRDMVSLILDDNHTIVRTDVDCFDYYMELLVTLSLMIGWTYLPQKMSN